MRRWLVALGTSASLVACGPTAKDIENSQIHYDLAVNAMENAHDAPQALRELELALQKNPGMAEAHNALGLVYHLMLHKPEEAVTHYLIALKGDPKNPEIANNLGASYLELGRYAEAATMFKQAVGNDSYRTPYIGEGNLGWALYKQGDLTGAVKHLKSSVSINPDYCQGYRSLGLIASDQGQLAEAQLEFEAFAKHCPTMLEANYRLGMVLLKLGDQTQAREQFGRCSSAPPSDLTTECDRLLKLMR